MEQVGNDLPGLEGERVARIRNRRAGPDAFAVFGAIVLHIERANQLARDRVVFGPTGLCFISKIEGDFIGAGLVDIRQGGTEVDLAAIFVGVMAGEDAREFLDSGNLLIGGAGFGVGVDLVGAIGRDGG